MILKALGVTWAAALVAGLVLAGIVYLLPDLAATPVLKAAMEAFFSAGILLLAATVPWLAIGVFVAIRRAVRSKGTRRFSAAVYELKDRILVHPWQQTAAGLGMASEPYLCLPLDADGEALGSAVLKALSDSGRTVPHPKSWKGLDKPRLEAAGVTSEKAFMWGARFANVERSASGFRVEPSRNGGTRGDAKGFEPLPDLSEALPLHASPAELGAQVRKSLLKCTATASE